jgi:competence CoiA-like predicted nuclease
MEYARQGTSNGPKVHISEANKARDYFCEKCGDQVTPRQGEEHRWHYAHKSDADCGHGQGEGWVPGSKR